MNCIELNRYQSILYGIEVRGSSVHFGRIIPDCAIKYMYFSSLGVDVSVLDTILSRYACILYSLRVVYKNFNVYMATEHLSVQLKE